MSAPHPELDHWMVKDLALRHYHGKWKAAKEHASGLHASYSDAWWMSARTHYLELGGEYQWQLPKDIREREELEKLL